MHGVYSIAGQAMDMPVRERAASREQAFTALSLLLAPDHFSKCTIL